jgi:hypothetical protein
MDKAASVWGRRFFVTRNPQGREKNMRKIIQSDLLKIAEPCRSCDIFAIGRGRNKSFYCNIKKAKLMGQGVVPWYPIPDCPKQQKRI